MSTTNEFDGDFLKFIQKKLGMEIDKIEMDEPIFKDNTLILNAKIWPKSDIRFIDLEFTIKNIENDFNHE